MVREPPSPWPHASACSSPEPGGRAVVSAASAPSSTGVAPARPGLSAPLAAPDTGIAGVDAGVLDHSPIPSLVLRDDELLHANAAAIRLLGLREAVELLGARLDQILPASREAGGALALPDATSPVAVSTHRLRRFDGRTLEVEIAAAPITWIDGPALHLVVLDVSARVRSEQREARMEARLRHAQKLESIGRLAAGIAHDYNDLLTGILAHAGLLASELSDPRLAREHLDPIEALARRAAQLTARLQSFGGEAPISARALSLTRLVEDLKPLLDAALPRRVALRHQLDPRIPGVDADPGRIEQVLMNLVQNAAESIGERSGVVGIGTGTMIADAAYLATTLGHEGLTPGPYAWLVVSDSGEGMTPEVLERAFEPFFGTRPERSGLGLSAVLGIVRSHRGAVKIDSRRGEGTVVRVLLPIAKPALPDAPRAPAAPPIALLPATTGCVLVADDEPAVRGAVRRILAREGFRVIEARDGREALDLLHRLGAEIDVAVLDLEMPGLSGDEVVRELRAGAPRPAILISSGHAPDVVAHRFASDAVDAFLPKPWGPHALLQRIRELLRRRG